MRANLNKTMKKLTSIICIALMSSSALAQGLVNFFNNSSTLISVITGHSPLPPIAGLFYFALLTAPTGSTDPQAFMFAGITGTNQASAGRFTGGFSVPVTGWAPGTTRAFRIFGWQADHGPEFNPAWLAPGGLGGYLGPPGGLFGVSAIAPSGTAGGGSQSIPPLNVFGGSEGIQSGFILGIPEPASTALMGLGAFVMLVFRRRQ